MQEVLRISVEQAAKLMGVSREYVRCGMITKELQIGTALKINGSKVHTYHIVPGKLARHLEISQEQLEEMINE